MNYQFFQMWEKCQIVSGADWIIKVEKDWRRRRERKKEGRKGRGEGRGVKGAGAVGDIKQLCY